MLRPRIIPVLLLKDDYLIKTRKFESGRYIGEPINIIKIFNELKVDELILLDIEATKNKRSISTDWVKRIGEEISTPFSIGGGITRLEQIRDILAAGAERVVIGAHAVLHPEFIKEASNNFGSSAIAVCIDVKKNFFGKKKVHMINGSKNSGLDPLNFALLMEEYGAGEIIIQSIDRDGEMEGYDVELLKHIADRVTIPVIALGGAASHSDLEKTFQQVQLSGFAAGSMFVYYSRKKGVLINYPAKNNVRFKM